MNIVKREKSKNYTTISNVFLRDKNLSIKAKGFLAVVMSLPEDWDFTINGICSVLKEGKTAIYSAIQELKDCGYCNVDVCRNEKGIITGNDYTFREFPNEGNPYSEEPHSDFRHTENPTQIIKEETNNGNDKIKKIEKEDKSSSKKDDYLPFAAEPQQEYGKVVEKKEWREDFNAYLNLVNQAKYDLLSDSEYKEYIEKYYPNADYENSVGKLVDGFWGKQEGWDYCKMKRKGKTINMLSTLKKNLDSRSRIVYKSLKPMRQNQVFNNTKSDVKVKLNPNVHLVDNDGKLSDGTFLKSDGLRYYFSYIDKKTYSIPLDAEPMPQSEKIAYDYKNGWYECE